MSDEKKKLELETKVYVVGPEVVHMECPDCTSEGEVFLENCSTCQGNREVDTTQPKVFDAIVFGVQTCEFMDEAETHYYYTLKRVNEEGEEVYTRRDADKVLTDKPDLDDYERCGGCSGWGLVPVFGGMFADGCDNCEGAGYIHKDQVADKPEAISVETEEGIYPQFQAPTDVN